MLHPDFSALDEDWLPWAVREVDFPSSGQGSPVVSRLLYHDDGWAQRAYVKPRGVGVYLASEVGANTRSLQHRSPRWVHSQLRHCLSRAVTGLRSGTPNLCPRGRTNLLTNRHPR